MGKILFSASGSQYPLSADVTETVLSRQRDPEIRALFALSDAGVVDFADWRTILPILEDFREFIEAEEARTFL